MPRPILLFSGPWADLPLEVLAAKAASWEYAGLELCCWGDHLEVQRGLSEDAYCPNRLDMLARHDLHPHRPPRLELVVGLADPQRDHERASGILWCSRCITASVSRGATSPSASPR